MAKASLQRVEKRAADRERRSKTSALKKLQARLEAVEEACETLTKAHQHNVEMMRQGFAINDAHISILQMISHDIVTGMVRMAPMEPDEVQHYKDLLDQNLPLKDYYEMLSEKGCYPHRLRDQILDLEWYHEQYNNVSRFLAFILWLREVTAKEEEGANGQAH